MEHFVGLDVSVRETSLCVVDHAGKIVKEARVPTELRTRRALQQGQPLTLGDPTGCQRSAGPLEGRHDLEALDHFPQAERGHEGARRGCSSTSPAAASCISASRIGIVNAGAVGKGLLVQPLISSPGPGAEDA